MDAGATLELKDRKAFYSPTEVARLAGVSASTVLGWIHSERLFAVQLSPRIYRIPLASVIRLLYPHQVRAPKVVRQRRASAAIDAEFRAHAREHRLLSRRAVRTAS